MRKGGTYKLDGKGNRQPVRQPKPDPEIDVAAKTRADNAIAAKVKADAPSKEV